MGQDKNKTTNGILFKEISKALSEVDGWGSVEIYVQNFKVTQITRRAIKKTSHDIVEEAKTA